MKPIITVILLLLILSAFSQNRENEFFFLSIKDQLKEHKVKTIRKYVSKKYPLESSCPDSISTYSLIHIFRFDSLGNFVQQQNYSFQGGLDFQIDYRYDDQSNLTGKSHVIYNDSTGEMIFTQTWLFKNFDQTNSKVEYLISPKGDTTVTNKIKYDQLGNLIELIRNDYYKWTFTYNDLELRTEEKVWENGMNNGQLASEKINHFYNDVGDLISSITIDPQNPGLILGTTIYSYDSRSLLTLKLDSESYWRVQPENKKPEDRKHFMKLTKTEFDYNEKELLIIESLYSNKSEFPFRCFKLTYEYY